MQSDWRSVVQEGAGMSCDQTDDDTLVFFDLETTGLDIFHCDIIQVSAISGDKIFNVYTYPRQQISEGASAVTGFTVANQTLFRHGVPMETKTHEEALTDFLAFLGTLHRPVLAGHNIKGFDWPIMARLLRELHLINKFNKVLTGFLDTLTLARDLLRNSGVKNFKQETLVKAILKKSYNAHDAMEDVKSLQELFYALNPTPAQMARHYISHGEMTHHIN